MYVGRLEEMQKLVNPVLEREQEFNERPQALDDLGAAIVHYEKILEQYAAQVSVVCTL